MKPMLSRAEVGAIVRNKMIYQKKGFRFRGLARRASAPRVAAWRKAKESQGQFRRGQRAPIS